MFLGRRHVLYAEFSVKLATRRATHLAKLARWVQRRNPSSPDPRSAWCLRSGRCQTSFMKGGKIYKNTLVFRHQRLIPVVILGLVPRSSHPRTPEQVVGWMVGTSPTMTTWVPSEKKVAILNGWPRAAPRVHCKIEFGSGSTFVVPATALARSKYLRKLTRRPSGLLRSKSANKREQRDRHVPSWPTTATEQHNGNWLSDRAPSRRSRSRRRSFD